MQGEVAVKADAGASLQMENNNQPVGRILHQTC